MAWLYDHPYRSALVGAGLLLAIGMFIVERKMAAPVSDSATAWGGANIQVLDPSKPQGVTSDASSRDTVQTGGRDVPITSYQRPTESTAGTSDDFDFESFIAQLSQPASQGDTPETTGTPAAYSFIPTGLISTTTPGKNYSPAQQALYAYGNELGSLIQSYEDRHRNDTVVLKNQIEDRSSAVKAAAVQSIGNDLQGLGRSIKGLDEEQVPQVMRTAHAALGDSYIEMGAKLAAIPEAESDQAFIAAINTYNTAADLYTTNFLAVATLLSVNGVRYADSEAGSVFTFSGGF